MWNQGDDQSSSLSYFLKDHRKLIIGMVILFIILLFVVVHPQLKAIFIQWFYENKEILYPILQLFVGGILGGIIAAFIFTYLFEKYVWEEKFDKLKEYFEGEVKEYGDLSRKYYELLKNLPDAIGGQFTKSLFEYPPIVSKELAKILSDLTDKWYKQYHERVLVRSAYDAYKIIQMYKIENAGRDTEEESMEVWKLEFQSTWEWVNDSDVVKYPLHDFMIVVSAPDEAIESFLSAIRTVPEKDKQRKNFFDFMRRENIVRSIISHKNDTQPLSEEAISQMLSIDALDVGGTEIELDCLDPVPTDKLPHGVYKAYKLPREHADKPLEPGQGIIINYRGQISIPVLNEYGHRTGKLFLSFPDVIAKKYTLSITYPDNTELKGLGKPVKILEEKSGIWFGHERLVKPLPSDGADLTGNFLPRRNEESVMKLERYKPLTDLNYILMYWEEKS